VKYDNRHKRGRDRVFLLLLFSLFLFASPFAEWWASSDLPWHFPFTIWGILIALVAGNQIWGGRP
jgi:hypothetical protein